MAYSILYQNYLPKKKIPDVQCNKFSDKNVLECKLNDTKASKTFDTLKSETIIKQNKTTEKVLSLAIKTPWNN